MNLSELEAKLQETGTFLWLIQRNGYLNANGTLCQAEWVASLRTGVLESTIGKGLTAEAAIAEAFARLEDPTRPITEVPSGPRVAQSSGPAMPRKTKGKPASSPPGPDITLADLGLD